MRIVIKVGTSTLAHSTGRMNIRKVEMLCKVLSDIKNAGNDIVLVSSGAIGMGMGKINMKERPTDMPTKQACAAIGQCELMYVYDNLFTQYNHVTAQVLLTGADIEHNDRCFNVTNTLNRLIKLGSIPIINENDTVSTDEIEIGDNDTLSAIVSCIVKADLLVILSDIDGLYDSDPRINKNAKLLKQVNGITEDIIKMATGSNTNLGTGGMATKINAGKIVEKENIDMIIMNGDNPSLLYDILEGKQVGTKFCNR